MRFAVIGDIHSNIYALDSVFQSILKQNIDFVLSTGDLVGYFAYPNEVVDFVRQHRILSIQGNHDQVIGSSLPVNKTEVSEESLRANASAGYTNMVLTDQNRSYLKALPTELKLSIQDFTIQLVHGSPRGISEYLYENSKELAEVSGSVAADIIICGHTHIPYYQQINNKHFINTGSVGKPKHGNPNATYSVVSIINNVVSSDIIQVPYDYEKLAKEIEDNGILSGELAVMLRMGY